MSQGSSRILGPEWRENHWIYEQIIHGFVKPRREKTVQLNRRDLAALSLLRTQCLAWMHTSPAAKRIREERFTAALKFDDVALLEFADLDDFERYCLAEWGIIGAKSHHTKDFPPVLFKDVQEREKGAWHGAMRPRL